MPSRRMATRYISTGLLKPIGLGFRSASQMAQQCKPACRSTINEACLGNCEDECLEKLLQVRGLQAHNILELSVLHRRATELDNCSHLVAPVALNLPVLTRLQAHMHALYCVIFCLGKGG